MKQTEREHESGEKAVTGAGQAGPDKREEGGAARPQSWTITPSTPQREARRSMSAAAASSRYEGRVFRVRYTFTPRMWQ